jgi:hypothetical protein
VVGGEHVGGGDAEPDLVLGVVLGCVGGCILHLNVIVTSQCHCLFHNILEHPYRLSQFDLLTFLLRQLYEAFLYVEYYEVSGGPSPPQGRSGKTQHRPPALPAS